MLKKARKYNFIYKTTCTITGKFYIGRHSTDNLDDGYLGSGKILSYSRAKYGDENHIREILEYADSYDELKIKERCIVNEQLLGDPLNMNLRIGGDGGTTSEAAKNMWLSSDYRLKQELSWTKERREKASRFLAALSTENWRNIEYRKLISIKMQKSIQEKWLDPIYREKVINSLNSTDSRKKISDGAKRRYTNVNERKKTSEKTKEKWKDPEYREMMILSQRGKYVGANNKLTGTRWAWVNRNNETKKIPLDELEHFLECGWIRGIGKKV